MIDAPARPAETHPSAPYDVLVRPVRCRRTVDGKVCNARGANIDWSRPTIHDWKCGKCGAQNVVYIPEAPSGSQSAGPL
jgi:hypothetical protein